jgi:hypothetical protein
MAEIINLTPHDVTVVCGDITKTFGKSGQVTRLGQTQPIRVGMIAGIDILKSGFGPTEGLPEPIPETYFIVSMVVAQANPHRRDLISPDTSPAGAIRDEDGKIIGTKGFVFWGEANAL